MLIVPANPTVPLFVVEPSIRVPRRLGEARAGNGAHGGALIAADTVVGVEIREEAEDVAANRQVKGRQSVSQRQNRTAGQVDQDRLGIGLIVEGNEMGAVDLDL